MGEDILDFISSISGIGRKKAKKLIDAGFSSMEAFERASLREIAEVEGIGPELALRIKEYVREKKVTTEEKLSLYLCPKCGALLEEGAERCENCGTFFEGEEEIDVEGFDKILDELEKELVLAQEPLPEVPEEAKEKPITRDFLERWKRVSGEEEVSYVDALEDQLEGYNKLLEADPNLERVWLKKGQVLVELGRYDEAVECYDKAAELAPEKESQYRLEILDILTSKEDRGLPIRRESEKPSQEDIELIERAIRHYDALLSLDPNLKMAWQTKGELLEKLGKHEEAIKCFDMAIEAAFNERAERIRALANLNRLETHSRVTRSKGLVEGLGRTNGLVNGLTNGKVNGLINGVGRVNGLVNGLVNGVGRVNGLVNGLINGNGIINGRASRQRPRVLPHDTRWLKGAVGVAAVLSLVILVPLLSLLIVPSVSPAIVIDGNFSDWNGVPRYLDNRSDQMANPDVNLLDYKLYAGDDSFYLYAKVKGNIFRGGGPRGYDSFYAFLDTDGNNRTGYPIASMGADALVELGGWNSSLYMNRVFRFDDQQGKNNWFSFKPSETVKARAAASELEARIWMHSSEGLPRIFLACEDTLGNFDFSDFVFTPKDGSVRVEQRAIAPEVVPQSSSVPLIRLRVKAALDTENTTRERPEITLRGFNVSKLGSVPSESIGLALYMDNGDGAFDSGDPLLSVGEIAEGTVDFSFDISLRENQNATFFVVADLSKAPLTSSVGAEIRDVNADATVSIFEEYKTLSYVGEPPATIVVDGAFADWQTGYLEDTDDDVVNVNASDRTQNQNIDIKKYGAQKDGSLFIFTEVDEAGRLLGGVDLPSLKTRPSPYAPIEKDTDRDTIPDTIDPFPSDFNNDGVPDALTANDVDEDNRTDYPLGTDYWINTTIPNASSFPQEYRNRTVSVFIGPIKRDLEGIDRAAVYIDSDNSTTGLKVYTQGKLHGMDYLVLVTGRDCVVQSHELYKYNDSAKIPWTLVGDVPVGIDSLRMEMEINESAVSLGDDFSIFILMTDWRRSRDVSDTPLSNMTTRSGGTRSVNGDNVVLNEIYPFGVTGEWIELCNPTDRNIDLSGWEIVVDGTTVYTFPSGTVIGAWKSGSEYLVVDLSPNSLPNGGANVKLVNGTENVDETNYPRVQNKRSWARYRDADTGKPIDTDSDFDWYISQNPSKGGPNDEMTPSMVVEKGCDAQTAAPGDEVIYTIYYNNTGSGNAKHVWLNDTLPDGVTYISSSKAYTSHDGNVYRWYFANVPRNSENSFTITVKVNDTVGDGDVLKNFVTLNYTDSLGNWQPGSNSSASFTVSRPVITVVKVADKHTAQPGDTIVYTIYYNNTGSANAGHVWINDTLPDNVTYQSSSEPYDSHDNNTYRWHFTSVAPGSHSFTITVTVDLDVPPGTTLLNWAFLNYSTTNNYWLEGSSDSATTYIPEFGDFAMPAMAIVALFTLFRRRIKKGKSG